MASTVQQSEMSAGEIVLGLLIEQPDTCYHLDKRIAERLGSAQFSRGAASRAVERLLERKLVRPADVEERPELRVVDGRKKTVYEATPSGVDHFERWLRASTQTPPVREELHAKIALWGAAELPRLIEIVREAELGVHAAAGRCEPGDACRAPGERRQRLGAHDAADRLSRRSDVVGREDQVAAGRAHVSRARARAQAVRRPVLATSAGARRGDGARFCRCGGCR